MKIWTFSDLHVNFSPYRLPDPQPEHDAVVIAGDIGEGLLRSLKWISEAGFTKPVCYCAGNHDFYKRAMDREVEKAREYAVALSTREREAPIYLLQNDAVCVEGARFIGATCWTDYKLMRADNQQVAMMMAESNMNDHNLIRLASKQYGRFKPYDALREHIASYLYIEQELAKPFDGPTIVVTHHAPAMKSVPPRYWGDILNAAYASHLDYLVNQSDLWLHGHIHQACDYRLGDGRVVCNPRGYPHESSGFDPALVVEAAKKALDIPAASSER